MSALDLLSARKLAPLTQAHHELIRLLARIAVEGLVHHCDDTSPTPSTDLDQHQDEANSDE